MFGILLQGIASLFGEIAGSLGKWMVNKRVESLFAVGFQNSLVALAFFSVFALSSNGAFRLNPASIPSLLFLVALSIAQAYASMKAMVLASRGTFNFIRVGTLPLLLIADLLVGYDLSNRQIIGIFVVICALLFLFVNHGIERKGAGLAAFTAVNGAASIALFQWHVRVWNSVAAEQIILISAQTLFFLIGAVVVAKENPFRLLRRRLPFLQSAAYAGDSFVGSFSILFAPASVIMAAGRSFCVLWGILFGNRIFHEKSLLLKIITFVLVTIGIVLMMR